MTENREALSDREARVRQGYVLAHEAGGHAKYGVIEGCPLCVAPMPDDGDEEMDYRPLADPAELDRLRAENTWLRNQMGDVRGMQSDGATPEEMDEALGRALAGERARQAFDESRGSIDETNAPKETS